MTQWRAVLVLVLALAFGASPLWVPDFGGFDPGSFPIPQRDPPVQPSGYAFAIWGIIYLWLIASAGFGLLKRAADPAWDRMRGPLAVSLAVGAIWLPVAVLSPVWATILIWAMLVPALMALLRAPNADPWMAALPLGLYAGWLSAASCVAVGLLLGGYGFLSEDWAALAMITLASALAYKVQEKCNTTPSYGVAVIWALCAIVVQNGVLSTVGLYSILGIASVAVQTVNAAQQRLSSQTDT